MWHLETEEKLLAIIQRINSIFAMHNSGYRQKKKNCKWLPGGCIRLNFIKEEKEQNHQFIKGHRTDRIKQ